MDVKFSIIKEVSQEQLDKALLPLTTAGHLGVRYSAAQATTFYTAPGGRVIGMTRGGKHYAEVAA